MREELGIAESGLSRVVRGAFGLLDQIAFFTAGEDKPAQSWHMRRGGTAWHAAGEIHSDIQRGFVRAEVIALGRARGRRRLRRRARARRPAPGGPRLRDGRRRRHHRQVHPVAPPYGSNCPSTTENTAFCGSRSTANRPLGTGIGPMTVWAPSSPARAIAASVSSTAEVEVPGRVPAGRHRHHAAVGLAVVERSTSTGPRRRGSARSSSRTARDRTRRRPRRRAREGRSSSAAPGPLTSAAPKCSPGCQTLSIAPCGSWKTASRPESPTSSAGRTTVAPSSCARAAAASASSHAHVAVPVRRDARLRRRHDRRHGLAVALRDRVHAAAGDREVLVVPAEEAGVEALRGVLIGGHEVDPAERPGRVAGAFSHGRRGYISGRARAPCPRRSGRPSSCGRRT